MTYTILFNVLMLLLAFCVGRRILPVGFLNNLIVGLHFTIGITTPSQDQVRRATVVWILSILVIVDVLFALLYWVL